MRGDLCYHINVKEEKSMLHTILSKINDAADYKLALRVVNYRGEVFSEEEVGELLELYKTYLCEVKSEAARRALLLVELTDKADELMTAPMAGLVEQESLEELELLGALVAKTKITAAENDVGALTEKVVGFTDGVLKTAVCRVLLDKLAASNELGAIREQITALSGVLTAAEDEELYDASVVVMGVRSQWR